MKLLVLASSLAFLSFTAQDKVTLKHQPKAGDKIATVQAMSMKVDATVTAGGQQQRLSMEQKGNEKKTTEILQVDGNKATKILYHYEEDIEEKKGPGQTEFVKEEQPLHGRKITVSLKDGKTVREGADGLDEKALKSLDLEDDFSKTFPAHPVGIGESWEVSGDAVKQIFNDEKMDGKITLKLVEVKEFQGKRSAFLDARVEIKGATDEGIQMGINLKGPVVVWLERGYTLQAKLDGTITMKAKNDEFEMNGQGAMKIEVNSTVK